MLFFSLQKKISGKGKRLLKFSSELLYAWLCLYWFMMRFPLPPALGALMSPFTKEGLNIRTPYIRKEISIAISSLLAASCTSTHNTEIFFTAHSGSAKPQTLMPLELDEQWGRYLRWLQLLHLSQAACSCVALSYLWSKSLKSHNP